MSIQSTPLKESDQTSGVMKTYAREGQQQVVETEPGDEEE
jgi:hypothetical protein